MMKKIVLASSSLHRKELLKQLGLNFEVDPCNVDEAINQDLEPHALVSVLSQAKAQIVVHRHPDAIIIAADTIGMINGKILGKPHTKLASKKMLSALSGKCHRVITGYTVVDSENGRSITKTVETLVYIKLLTPTEIDNYVATGEPLDKAGAYGIQGRGAVIVEKLEGDYYNVVGLPLFAVAETLREFGIQII